MRREEKNIYEKRKEDRTKKWNNDRYFYLVLLLFKTLWLLDTQVPEDTHHGNRDNDESDE